MNQNMNAAKRVKNDEFYTQLADIENEVECYRTHFAGKTVYCNCDDPRASNFWKYFVDNFQSLGLKRLISTCYKNQNMDLFSTHSSERAIMMEYDGDALKAKRLKGDGDFRSAECVKLLEQSDIVVTNPPFSLFREYVAQLMKYNKEFLIIGNMNAITYKKIYGLIEEGKLWIGNRPMNRDMLFDVLGDLAEELVATKKEGNAYKIVNGVIKVRLGNICWFTNLEYNKRHEDLILYKEYSPEEYPKYDNYDAIEVSKTADIPKDYSGAMGVPITFLDKHNPEQFEIVRFRTGDDGKDLRINGKRPYFRILIKHKQD